MPPSATETPVQLIQRQLDAYNAHDLDAFLACFAPDVRVEELDGGLLHAGHAAVSAHYRARFADNPRLRASLLDRVSVGAYVIDEELLDGLADGTTQHVVAIYRIVDGLIGSVRFLR